LHGVSFSVTNASPDAIADDGGNATTSLQPYSSGISQTTFLEKS
jgi:hypothetical protein